MKMVNMIGEGTFEAFGEIVLHIQLCLMGYFYSFTLFLVFLWGTVQLIVRKARNNSRIIIKQANDLKDGIFAVLSNVTTLIWSVYMGLRSQKVLFINIIFKFGCIYIISTILSAYYTLIYILVGIVFIFLAAYISYAGTSQDERLLSALFYATTNLFFVSRCPMSNPAQTFPQVLAVTSSWVLLHMTTMVGFATYFTFKVG